MKVVTDGGPVPEDAVAYLCRRPLDLEASLAEIWPAEVERLGLRFVSFVADEALRVFLAPAGSAGMAYRAANRRTVLRSSDLVLCESAATRTSLADDLGVEDSRLATVGSAEPEAVREAAEHSFGDGLNRRPWRAPRVALVSPFPPVASGVAAYSAGLVSALARRLSEAGVALDLFADGLDRLPVGEAGGRPAPPAGLFAARSFLAVDRVEGGYERAVYVLGNSEFHTGALTALRRRGGIVMAHEARFTGLLRHSVHVAGAVPGGFEFRVRQSYGDGADPTDDTLLMARDVLAGAEEVLLSSAEATELALSDFPAPEAAPPMRVVPFAMALPADELETVAGARATATGNLVASFGIVDPSKLPHLLIASFAIFADSAPPGDAAELVFVGPVSDPLREELESLAGELGIGDRIQLTGHVDRSTYLSYLGRATVAVQLRMRFFGEASAAVGDCLSAGVPTIVSDLGWMAGLPDDAVMKVAAHVHDLAAALGQLLGSAERREELGRMGAGLAAEATFDRAAASLVDALRLG